MAEQTGGHAFVNTNGLADAVTRAINDGSNHYTLTYSPIDIVNDGKFRKIQVKSRRQGLVLAYRRGYYADADAAHKPAPTTTSAGPIKLLTLSRVTDSFEDPMHDAMIFGSPNPTQITLKVLVLSAAGQP